MHGKVTHVDRHHCVASVCPNPATTHELEALPAVAAVAVAVVQGGVGVLDLGNEPRNVLLQEGVYPAIDW